MGIGRATDNRPHTTKIYASVSERAGTSWHDFSHVNEISISALLDALAPYLEQEANVVLLDVVVADARRIDADNRQRLRRSGLPRPIS